MKCPKCNLVNFEEAIDCPCGYNFKTGKYTPKRTDFEKDEKPFEDEKKMKERKPIIAFLLSLITKGLGQIYNGEIKKGILLFFAEYLLLLILRLINLPFSFGGGIIVLIIDICYILYIITDSVIIAKRVGTIKLRSYNKWYFYILFIIIASVTSQTIKYKAIGIKTYKIPAGSMKHTLLIGDHIVVNLGYYNYNSPKRGDIIVFKYPKDESREFIKRIIAKEGDTFEIKNQQVYFNGNVINEPYLKHMMPSNPYDNPRDNYGSITIPKNKLFVMGDNRENSQDSRFWGLLDIKKIKGKALYIYWSKDKSRIGSELL